MKAVLFDFGGTLDADGIAWKERFHACYRAEGLDLGEDLFARRFYDADDPLVGGIPDTMRFDETVRLLAANIESELDGGDPERGRRVADRFIGDSRAVLNRNAEVLARLSKRYELGVVSNFYGNLEAICRDTGLEPYLTVAVDSTKAGIEKPDPAIFQAALDVLEARPEECVFVGDSLRRDRVGARNIGMPFIWVAAPEALKDADVDAKDWVVSSVADVESALA